MRYREMTESSEIQQLREDIQELRLLYGWLAEMIIPEEKATPEDIESVETPDEIVTKEEFLLALEEAPVKKSRKSSVLGNR
jgi:archaellum component FlaC